MFAASPQYLCAGGGVGRQTPFSLLSYKRDFDQNAEWPVSGVEFSAFPTASTASCVLSKQTETAGPFRPPAFPRSPLPPQEQFPTECW